MQPDTPTGWDVREVHGARGWKGLDNQLLRAAGFVYCDGRTAKFPVCHPDGTLFRERIITSGGKRLWDDQTGKGVLLIGLETLPPVDDAEQWIVILCEGESDMIALREAFAERWDNYSQGNSCYRRFAVVALPGANVWKREWALYFAAFPVVYVIGDGDALETDEERRQRENAGMRKQQAGRQMIARVLADVPWARPIYLDDGDDARSVLQGQGNRALDPYLLAADELAHLDATLKGGIPLAA